VPPINVLIVEDNIINLKLLEAFMKRLKVRWQTAMNGKEAVSKWRTGGFHLVLMDIQLPVMNGLEATKEIRRLERLNSIGVFWSSASPSAPETDSEAGPTGADKLTNTYLFKSPIIIVALTASSLQSDRHEALAAGCNDFLTKVRRACHSFLYLYFCKVTNLNTRASPSTSFGWSEKLWNGVACKPSLTSMDGESGKISLRIQPRMRV
jgi:CheY-like chemotaxis protein